MPNARKMEWALVSICRALESEELVTDETLAIMERFVKSHSSSNRLDLSAYRDLSVINKCLHNTPTTEPGAATREKAELMLVSFSKFLGALQNTRMQHESEFLSRPKLLEQHELHSTKEYALTQHLATLKQLGFAAADIECMSEYKIAIVGIYGNVLFDVLGLKKDEYITFIHECTERKILALYRHHNEIIRVVTLKTAMTFSDSKISGICEIILSLNKEA